MKRPALSVLIAAYNEEETIVECIERVERVAIEMEIIIVNDGSTDGTRAALDTLALTRDPERFRVLHSPRNEGKGAALRRGIPLCRGEMTIVQDADLEYDPQDYPALTAPIEAGASSVVYGSRRLHPERSYPLDRHLLGSYLLTTVANLLYGAGITDEPTCYKVFRTELLQSLPLCCRRFEFCPEVTALLALRGYAIEEVPIRYSKRSVAQGKKIRWTDWVMALVTLLRLRLPWPQ